MCEGSDGIVCKVQDCLSTAAYYQWQLGQQKLLLCNNNQKNGPIEIQPIRLAVSCEACLA
jgi:hypothetical protein